MKNVSLRLKGFRGIRDGLGHESIELDFEKLAGDAALVAIVGKNGRGKTTIMDNMTPFPVMPSRAGVDGRGSFSYYDHVYLPESVKDLVWEHEDTRYRSQLVFRVNGKKRAEAFLHVRRGDQWEPVRIDDGTVSDGKMDTYERCLEAILGSAETFFTSVFSAQGKRQLSAYKNGEIKTLLADLLGLEKIQDIGRQTAETVKLLKTGVAGIRQEAAGLRGEADQVAQQRSELGDTQTKVNTSEESRMAAQRALDDAKALVAKVSANREAALQMEARRTQLAGERKALIEAGKNALAALDEQDVREAARLAQLDQRIAKRAESLQTRRRDREEQCAKLQRTVASGTKVGWAQRRLSMAETIVEFRDERLTGMRRAAQRLEALAANEQLAAQRLAAIDREAGQAALKAEELTRRFGLTAEVPCAGTDLQGLCKLLGDAREAKALIPSAEIQIGRLVEEKASLTAHLKDVQREISKHAAVKAVIVLVEAKLRRARQRAAQLAVLAARQGELDQAQEALGNVSVELEALGRESVKETNEETVERKTIAETHKAVIERRESQAEQHRDSLARMDAAIKALPGPFDPLQLREAEQRVVTAQSAFTATEAAFLKAVCDRQTAAEVDKRAATVKERMDSVDRRAQAVEAQLGIWTLFAKCMSNDGVIALCIDDAGPTLAGFTNDLLLACYGPRFTVSIRTQVETGKGEAREGFDVIVHDAQSSESKSVTLMSGGERVWINECLTRAIAIYLAHNSGRRYGTLFSDEVDGSLDEERKRMFMAMKREVLRLGGYEREFFISQTPELAAMADAIIDLDSFAANRTEERERPCIVE